MTIATKIKETGKLLRFFTSFPNGLHGTALLLMRLTLSATAFVAGGNYLADGFDSAARNWIIGAIYLACGASFLIGLLTPQFAVLFCLGAGFSAISAASPIGQILLGYRLAALYAIVMAIAVVLLGPGAFSLDARLFGRREIIIPNDSPPNS